MWGSQSEDYECDLKRSWCSQKKGCCAKSLPAFPKDYFYFFPRNLALCTLLDHWSYNTTTLESPPFLTESASHLFILRKAGFGGCSLLDASQNCL
ncbi:hypothetical protein AV530_012658 [Patagioenas fasciata monilis]|uniref:Uncharacterized protein n=1 Tax=Patagioenas fasciata monilis TaxID=372326 RepID=A0A1V4JCA7_PATFA|nr:hypothetical protein AV530_012658 [Patagioenas fasciata monilis]